MHETPPPLQARTGTGAKFPGVVRRRAHAALVFAVLSLGAQAAEPAGNTIITFGDSTTVGHPYLGSGHGWGAGGCHDCGPTQKRLEDLLRGSGRDALVLNYGLGGESTDQGVSRIKNEIRDAKARHPAAAYYVLLLEGANDGNVGISTETTKFNLGQMIDKIRARDAVPLLGTITPSADPGNRREKRNRLIRALAREKNVTLVDHYAAMVDDWDDLRYDEIHPNEKGYRLMADNWFAQLKGMIVSRSSSITPILQLLLE